MRWLLLWLLAVQAYGQGLSYHDFSVNPVQARQGMVLKISGSPQARTARFNGRTIPVFPGNNSLSFGLMSIGVLTKPGTYALQWFDAQGAELHSQEIVVASGHFPRQNIVLTKALTELRSTEDERATVSAFLHKASPVRLWEEPLEVPFQGCVTSPFGVARLHNGKATGDFHAGLDQRGAMGAPIHAVAAGTVEIAKVFSLRGGTVAIDHGQGLQSMYLHMSEVVAKPEQQVKRGDVIGYVGSTGRSTGPHLHWTLYANGEPIDPTQWIHVTQCAKPVPRPRPKRRVPSA